MENDPLDPCLVGDWDRALMIHLEVDPAELQSTVPFELDLHEGHAFISLVAFTLRGCRPRVGGMLTRWLFQPISTHEFLNVRTYVRMDDMPGIHFLAEWLPNRLAVELGPRTFALPYRYGRIRYKHAWEQRRLDGEIEDPLSGCVVAYKARLAPECEFQPCEEESLDEWFMERYSAYNAARGRERMFRVWHPPWPQAPAEMEWSDLSLLEEEWPWMGDAVVAGANFSPGLKDVWMGRPRAIPSTAT